MIMINPYQFSAAAVTTLKTGLIGCWELNETSGTVAEDVHGTNDLTISGATINQTGKLDKCYSFDGNDHLYRNTGLVSVFPFTIAAWFKTSTTPAATMTIMSVGDKDIFNKLVGFGVSTTGKLLIYNYNSTFLSATSVASFNDGNWHLAVAVFNSNTDKRLYVDGALVATLSTSCLVPAGIDNITIGKLARYVTDGYFTGNIDQSDIWSKALTGTEIAALYNGGAGLAYSAW